MTQTNWLPSGMRLTTELLHSRVMQCAVGREETLRLANWVLEAVC